MVLRQRRVSMKDWQTYHPRFEYYREISPEIHVRLRRPVVLPSNVWSAYLIFNCDKVNQWTSLIALDLKYQGRDVSYAKRKTMRLVKELIWKMKELEVK